MEPINTNISNVTSSTPYAAHKSEGYMRWNEQDELVDMTAHQQEMNLKKLKADWIYMCRFCQQAFSIAEGWYEHSHIPNG
jgi:hypothetical protein